MDEASIRHQLNQATDMLSINRLTELGNQAIAKGLIVGHGFRDGRYEILSKTDVSLLSLEKALSYLEELLQS